MFALCVVFLVLLTSLVTPTEALLTRSALLVDFSLDAMTMTDTSALMNGGAHGSSAGCLGPVRVSHVLSIGIQRFNYNAFSEAGSLKSRDADRFEVEI